MPSDQTLRKVRQSIRKLTTADEKVKLLVEERDEAIRAARADGHSLRVIAEIVGVSHTAISNIVRRPDQVTEGDAPAGG